MSVVGTLERVGNNLICCQCLWQRGFVIVLSTLTNGGRRRAVQCKVTRKEKITMANQEFKEPFNIYYFLGVVAVLLIPTLPATLTWIRVLNGYATF